MKGTQEKRTALRLLFLIVTASMSSTQGLTLPNKYDSSIRPNNDGVADVVNISMQIISIGNVNEEDHEISVDFLLRAFWVDKRLANIVERETIFVDKIPEVWIPHLSIVNSIDDVSHQGTSKRGLSLKLKSDGVLDYSERISTRLNCPMSFTKYPFGHQTCQIQMNSNGYTTIHLVLIWHGLISQNIPVYDPEYSLNSIEQSSTREKTPTGEYSYSFVDIKLTRWPVRILARGILPCVFFCILSYFVTFFMFMTRKKNNKEMKSSKKSEEEDPPDNDDDDDETKSSPMHFSNHNITPNILRVSTNALIFLIVIIIRQINFVISPRSGSITGMDISTGLMAAIILICFILSLQMCFIEWLKRALEDQEIADETGKVTRKVFTILQVSIPMVIVIFLIAYFVFSLS